MKLCKKLFLKVNRMAGFFQKPFAGGQMPLLTNISAKPPRIRIRNLLVLQSISFISQLTGGPSRKDASSQGLWIPCHAELRMLKTAEVLPRSSNFLYKLIGLTWRRQ